MKNPVKKTIYDLLMLFMIFLILFFVFVLWVNVENYQSERESITLTIDDVNISLSTHPDELFSLYAVNYHGYYGINTEAYGLYRSILKPNLKVGDTLVLEKMVDYPNDLVREIEIKMISTVLTIISLLLLLFFIRSKKRKIKVGTINSPSTTNFESGSKKTADVHKNRPAININDKYTKKNLIIIIILHVVFILLEFFNAVEADIFFLVIPCELFLLLRYHRYSVALIPALLLYNIICSVLAEMLYPKRGLDFLWYYINFAFKSVLILLVLFIIWRMKKNKER